MSALRRLLGQPRLVHAAGGWGGGRLPQAAVSAARRALVYAFWAACLLGWGLLLFAMWNLVMP